MRLNKEHQFRLHMFLQLRQEYLVLIQLLLRWKLEPKLLIKNQSESLLTLNVISMLIFIVVKELLVYFK